MPLDCPLADTSNVGIINFSSGDYVMASVLRELSFSQDEAVFPLLLVN